MQLLGEGEGDKVDDIVAVLDTDFETEIVRDTLRETETLEENETANIGKSLVRWCARY